MNGPARSDLAARVAADGYAVVSPGALAGTVDPMSFVDVVSAVGDPVRVFPGDGLWREISVRPDKHPNRSEGVGESPLHMDFVNAANPPDYVCLLCVRPDPAGGGASLLAPTAARLALSAAHLRRLAEPVFRDGRVEGLTGIGVDVNPFKVVDDGAYWDFRYTGALLDSAHDRETGRSLDALAAELKGNQVELLLRPGDALIFDQHRWVHGKKPLGGRGLPERGRKRLLLQSFYRDRANPFT